MQTKPTLLALGLALILSATAHAQLSIPSDGSDGAFSPNANVVIDLGLAANGIWNTAGSGNGVYDAEKWAVVFKYSSVNIPSGVKVTFKNHPTYAPVVWLVQGNVTIAGELNLDGNVGVADGGICVRSDGSALLQGIIKAIRKRGTRPQSAADVGGELVRST